MPPRLLGPGSDGASGFCLRLRAPRPFRASRCARLPAPAAPPRVVGGPTSRAVSSAAAASLAASSCALGPPHAPRPRSAPVTRPWTPRRLHLRAQLETRVPQPPPRAGRWASTASGFSRRRVSSACAPAPARRRHQPCLARRAAARAAAALLRRAASRRRMLRSSRSGRVRPRRAARLPAQRRAAPQGARGAQRPRPAPRPRVLAASAPAAPRRSARRPPCAPLRALAPAQLEARVGVPVAERGRERTHHQRFALAGPVGHRERGRTTRSVAGASPSVAAVPRSASAEAERAAKDAARRALGAGAARPRRPEFVSAPREASPPRARRVGANARGGSGGASAAAAAGGRGATATMTVRPEVVRAGGPRGVLAACSAGRDAFEARDRRWRTHARKSVF